MVRSRPVMEILLVLGRALHCLRKQQPYLICFLEDSWLESSNNRGKRSVKLLVMRWKNWLFSNTEGCAQNRTIADSPIETTKKTGLVPDQYLI